MLISPAHSLAARQNRFGIALNSATLAFVPLRSRYLVEDSTWPRFTLLGQSVGSMYLALQGLREGFIPDIWIGGALRRSLFLPRGDN